MASYINILYQYFVAQISGHVSSGLLTSGNVDRSKFLFKHIKS